MVCKYFLPSHRWSLHSVDYFLWRSYLVSSSPLLCFATVGFFGGDHSQKVIAQIIGSSFHLAFLLVVSLFRVSWPCWGGVWTRCEISEDPVAPFCIRSSVLEWFYHHWWKRLLFPHRAFLALLSKVDCLETHGFILSPLFCSIFLWVCFLCQYHSVLMNTAL